MIYKNKKKIHYKKSLPVIIFSVRDRCHRVGVKVIVSQNSNLSGFVDGQNKGYSKDFFC